MRHTDVVLAVLPLLANLGVVARQHACYATGTTTKYLPAVTSRIVARGVKWDQSWGVRCPRPVGPFQEGNGAEDEDEDGYGYGYGYGHRHRRPHGGHGGNGGVLIANGGNGGSGGGRGGNGGTLRANGGNGADGSYGSRGGNGGNGGFLVANGGNGGSAGRTGGYGSDGGDGGDGGSVEANGGDGGKFGGAGGDGGFLEADGGDAGASSNAASGYEPLPDDEGKGTYGERPNPFPPSAVMSKPMPPVPTDIATSEGLPLPTDTVSQGLPPIPTDVPGTEGLPPIPTDIPTTEGLPSVPTPFVSAGIAITPDDFENDTQDESDEDEGSDGRLSSRGRNVDVNLAIRGSENGDSGGVSAVARSNGSAASPARPGLILLSSLTTVVAGILYAL
ncbi:hypothetical protein E4U55_005488 [Claviceps digitariae]|nr:hypothetical protein E4U55_005488 [Claviceps digitariae]